VVAQSSELEKWSVLLCMVVSSAHHFQRHTNVPKMNKHVQKIVGWVSGQLGLHVPQVVATGRKLEAAQSCSNRNTEEDFVICYPRDSPAWKNNVQLIAVFPSGHHGRHVLLAVGLERSSVLEALL
jgi:hypothetical protein